MDTKSIKKCLAKLTTEDLLSRFLGFAMGMDITNKEHLKIASIFKKELLKRTGAK